MAKYSITMDSVSEEITIWIRLHITCPEDTVIENNKPNSLNLIWNIFDLLNMYRLTGDDNDPPPNSLVQYRHSYKKGYLQFRLSSKITVPNQYAIYLKRDKREYMDKLHNSLLAFTREV